MTPTGTDIYLFRGIVTPRVIELILTFEGRARIADILQKTFTRMKMYQFSLMFHRSLFLMSELTIFQHGFR